MVKSNNKKENGLQEVYDKQQGENLKRKKGKEEKKSEE